jgi:peptidoglycan/xylan/chitin deacetylase (PgdA/CDA1 family)
VGFRRGGRVALTFDDGPSEWTEAIVEELQRHGARATFFVLGCQVEGREGVLRRAASAGCELALHGYSHRRLTHLSDDEVREEMGRTSASIEAATGQTPRLWRAPHFDVDDRVRALCADLGLTEVWLTADTEDYARDADEVTARAAAGLRPGAIILMHDGRSPLDTPDDSQVTRSATVAAVPRILSEGQRRGLQIGTVGELTQRRRGRHGSVIGLPSHSVVSRAGRLITRLSHRFLARFRTDTRVA